jgi:hypothetical protein
MIQIKNPCDANWKEMTPAESGKYCGACEKVVVDFSKMNDAEIKNYFITYKEQKTCGRFLDSQLERPLVVPPTLFNKFLNRFNQIPLTQTILLFLTSTSMWISSCVKNSDATTGKLTAPIDTTESCSVETMGFVAPIIKKQDSLLIKQNPDENVIMGEVAPQPTIKVIPPPDFFMGDVAVEPDTVAVTIPATTKDTSDITLHMMMGKVMLKDTISQKIKRRK